MTTFKVPDSAEEAVEQLGHVGRRMDALTKIMTAKKWERAALIATLVGPAPGAGPGRGRKGPHLDTFPYTVKSLAELGIHGLSSRQTITEYRDAWCRDGRTPPDFGDEIDLDSLPDWTGTKPERPLKATPASRPEPEEEPDDDGTTFRVDEQLVTRMALRNEAATEEPDDSEEEEPSEVVVHMRNYDSAHLNVDRALELLKSARRSRDEDYPHLNTYQKYSVRGWLTQIRQLADELWPVIEEEGDANQRSSN